MKRQRSLLIIGSMILGVGALGLGQMFSEKHYEVAAHGTFDIEEVQPTSSAAIRATTALRTPDTDPLSDAPTILAELTPEEAPLPVAQAEVFLAAAPGTLDTEADLAAAGDGCEMTLSALPGENAMVNLRLDAPCDANTRFILHHSGMMFQAATDDRGRWQQDVPAMAQTAVFIAAFDSGAGAVASTFMPGMTEIQRVAVQWGKVEGFELHALEFGAQYFQPGHVWYRAPGDVSQGSAGFLTQLGDASLDDPLLVQIYTLPQAQDLSQGNVALSVEAEITAANCGQEISAQTLELRATTEPRVRDVTIAVPECGAVGEFLVLKNTPEDLTIARN